MNSWSVMAPQALMGVAAVAVLYCGVRRAFTDPDHGAAAGLLATAVLAGTPPAAVVVRFNQPHPPPGLFLAGAPYSLLCAAPPPPRRWVGLGGSAVGTAVLSHM